MNNDLDDADLFQRVLTKAELLEILDFARCAPPHQRVLILRMGVELGAARKAVDMWRGMSETLVKSMDVVRRKN